MTPRLVRGILLLGFALLIAKIFLAGQMPHYMAPTLDPLTGLTAVVLAVMGAIELRGVLRRPLRRDPRAAGQDQDVTGLMLAVPIILGLALAPKALGASIYADQDLTRFMVTVSPLPSATRAERPPAAAEPIEDIDRMVAALRPGDDRPAGRRARAVGLGVRGAGLGSDELTLLRFTIVHCVADAQPLGLLVVAPDGASWERDQWVQVDGVLDTRDRAGARLVTIVADSIVPIEEPRTPYLTQ